MLVSGVLYFWKGYAPPYRLSVHSIRVLGRPASPAFCPGYDGPLEPSPVEHHYDSLWFNREVPTRFADGSQIRLHVYRAAAGYYPPKWDYSQGPAEVLEFSVPEPYSGRDIVTFAAFDKQHFVYELRDGNLYSSKSGEIELLESDLTEPTVWGRMVDGNIYYAVGREEAQAGGFWNAIRRVTPRLEIATVWESSTHRIESLSLSESLEHGVFEIGIRLGDLEEETVVIRGAPSAPALDCR